MKCEGAPVFQPRPRLDWQLQLASPQVHFHHFNLTRRRTVWGGKWDHWEKELVRRKVGEGNMGWKSVTRQELVWKLDSKEKEDEGKLSPLKSFTQRFLKWFSFFFFLYISSLYLSCTVAAKGKSVLLKATWEPWSQPACFLLHLLWPILNVRTDWAWVKVTFLLKG